MFIISFVSIKLRTSTNFSRSKLISPEIYYFAMPIYTKFTYIYNFEANIDPYEYISISTSFKPDHVSVKQLNLD